ncbi:MAG TPA: hypothetical protein P5527_10200 [Kiritimatiellia bacterium]|nr:hypothetical protein [Kiritimatiellia bacterium]
MKKERTFQLTVCVVSALSCLAGSVMAQSWQQRAAASKATVAKKEETVKIARLPPPGKTAMVRTPEFQYSVNNTQPRVNRRPREWALFEVKYETSAKWTDELTFIYHIMTKGRDDDNKDIYSYYTTTIKYIDIPKGDHMSCVALPPSLVERYGEPVAIALEISGKDGTVMASESLSAGIQFQKPKEWWRDTSVMDARDKEGNPVLIRRPGLLERSKTPFALVNPDDYEVVQ